MKIYTIGFSQKSAKKFFDLLSKNGVNCLVDIRLRPSGQLAGFTKQEDLRFFLKELINCDYQHLTMLTPTDQIFKTYRTDKNWEKYERSFKTLMKTRLIPESLDRQLFEVNNCCLLCSEATPDFCHRRLVAELLQEEWQNVKIIHL